MVGDLCFPLYLGLVAVTEPQEQRTRRAPTALLWRRHEPSDEGISSLSRPHRSSLVGPQSRNCRAAGRTSRAVCLESAQAGTEAKDRAEIRRPRRELITHRSSESDQILVGQAPADDAVDREAEAIRVVHVAPIVEPEGLLVQIPEQVERLDRYVGAVQGPFEQAPEVLAAVRVDRAVHVTLGVVNDLVGVVGNQPV